MTDRPKIAVGSVAICGGQAKICIGCVMPVGSRKIAYRYVMIGVGCSVDHCGLSKDLYVLLSIGYIWVDLRCCMGVVCLCNVGGQILYSWEKFYYSRY
jgi:hypothetical protein